MKNSKFKVTFITGQIEVVITDGKNSAMILAQAEQIKKGHNHDVLSITIIED